MPSPAPFPDDPTGPDELVDLAAGRTGYAAGFLFDEDDRVVLVRKLRPAWQSGMLNGVGGKIEPGETPRAAMRREFREEAGIDVPTWDHFATLTFPAGTVWFFRHFAEASVLDSVSSHTDEPIEVVRVSPLLVPGAATIANLRWLLPLGAYRHDLLAPVVVRELSR